MQKTTTEFSPTQRFYENVIHRVCSKLRLQWTHKASGRTYVSKIIDGIYKKPKSMEMKNGEPVPSTMRDDDTDEPLVQLWTKALTIKLKEKWIQKVTEEKPYPETRPRSSEQERKPNKKKGAKRKLKQKDVPPRIVDTIFSPQGWEKTEVSMNYNSLLLILLLPTDHNYKLSLSRSRH